VSDQDEACDGSETVLGWDVDQVRGLRERQTRFQDKRRLWRQRPERARGTDGRGGAPEKEQALLSLTSEAFVWARILL
jgi:hypothetical protein